MKISFIVSLIFISVVVSDVNGFQVPKLSDVLNAMNGIKDRLKEHLKSHPEIRSSLDTVLKKVSSDIKTRIANQHPVKDMGALEKLIKHHIYLNLNQTMEYNKRIHNISKAIVTDISKAIADHDLNALSKINATKMHMNVATFLKNKHIHFHLKLVGFLKSHQFHVDKICHHYIMSQILMATVNMKDEFQGMLGALQQCHLNKIPQEKVQKMKVEFHPLYNGLKSTTLNEFHTLMQKHNVALPRHILHITVIKTTRGHLQKYMHHAKCVYHAMQKHAHVAMHLMIKAFGKMDKKKHDQLTKLIHQHVAPAMDAHWKMMQEKYGKQGIDLDKVKRISMDHLGHKWFDESDESRKHHHHKHHRRHRLPHWVRIVAPVVGLVLLIILAVLIYLIVKKRRVAMDMKARIEKYGHLDEDAYSVKSCSKA